MKTKPVHFPSSLNNKITTKTNKQNYHSSRSLSGDGELVVILIILEQKIWVAIIGTSEIFTQISA